MAWTVEFKQSAFKQLEKLDRQEQRRILGFLNERIVGSPDPRQQGKVLQGDRHGLWRYRVSDYRLICELQDQKLAILLLAVGHRVDIYRRHKRP